MRIWLPILLLGLLAGCSFSIHINGENCQQCGHLNRDPGLTGIKIFQLQNYYDQYQERLRWARFQSSTANFPPELETTLSPGTADQKDHRDAIRTISLEPLTAEDAKNQRSFPLLPATRHLLIVTQGTTVGTRWAVQHTLSFWQRNVSRSLDVCIMGAEIFLSCPANQAVASGDPAGSPARREVHARLSPTAAQVPSAQLPQAPVPPPAELPQAPALPPTQLPSVPF